MTDIATRLQDLADAIGELAKRVSALESVAAVQADIPTQPPVEATAADEVTEPEETEA